MIQYWMLSAWSATQHRLVPVDVADPTTAVATASGAAARWLHAHAPTEAEQQSLIALGMPAAFLEHALDVNEVARVDHEPGARLVIVRVPWPTDGEEPWRTAPIGVVVLEGRLITLCAADDDLLTHVGLPNLETADPTRFVLRLLERTAASFLRDLESINRAVDDVEGRLQDAQENAEVRALLRLQKSLVHFETALRSNQMMLGRLRKDARFPRVAEDDDLFEDVEVELGQAAEMAAISTSILSGTMDAYASIISNNLNVVMKRLTSLTILVSIPTVVASIYGMNVVLPAGAHPHAFVVLTVISLSFVVAVGIVFRRRRWL